MLNMKYLTGLILLTIFFFGGVSCEENNENEITKQNGESAIDWNAAADSSVNSLIDHYWDYNGHFFTMTVSGDYSHGYWPQAHALDVLLDAYQRTDSSDYTQFIDDWYAGVKQVNGGAFYNVFYDDMEWIALAMLRTYNTIEDERFKTSSINLWEDIITGWSDVAGGGIMWKKNTPNSKDACSNGPAAILSARLYQLTQNEKYLDWAKKIYNWEKNTLVDPASGAVWNGANKENGQININKDWIFTYNQGTFIGAAVELYEITNNNVYLNDAKKTANYTLNSLINSNDRLLVDEGDGDGGLFKGIFVRYLVQLIQVPDLIESARDRYVAFLKHNAENLWREGTRKPEVFFGTYWGDKPADNPDLSTQLSGAMLIEATAFLDNNDYLEN